MILNGAEILIESLIDHGVDTIFGYPGGAVINIYDALFKYKDKINHILTAHEQGAAHAADGYSRSTGKVGVCLATSGPGATNLVTGIATAYMDSIPMVIITGNVPNELLGKDAFQEVDIVGITMPITKHNYMISDIRDLQEVIGEAFRIAVSGRPGPVLIDIPKNITSDVLDYESKPPKAVYRSSSSITEESINKVAKLINDSKRPFIYSGGGVVSSEAFNELNELVEKINSPISTSLMGLSGYSSDNELFTGMIGMHGTKVSNTLITESDLVICIGARFSDRVLSNREHISNAKIVHIDVDCAEINKNIKSDEYIVGDVKEVLVRLNPVLNNKCNEEWIDRLKSLKANDRLIGSEGNQIQSLFNFLNSYTNGDAIIVTDVGQHQMWTAANYRFKKPRSFITSGGLGAMGFGVGAAIGSQIANKSSRVILITGDGSFGMNCNEVATIASNNLPVKIIVLNNNALGMVRQWQSLFFENRYFSTTLNRGTDFVKLAESFGINGYRIFNNDSLENVLKDALDSDEASVIEYVISEDIKVLPMVAPGDYIGNIISK